MVRRDLQARRPCGVVVAMLVVGGVALSGCRTGPGDTCTSDEQCGPGFDCWQERCARVCADPGQCAAGETCVRYRCVRLTHATGRTAAPAHAVTATDGAPSGAPPGVERAAGPPPLPDPTEAELRAIRRELELLRVGQQRILEALDKGEAEGRTR